MSRVEWVAGQVLVGACCVVLSAGAAVGEVAGHGAGQPPQEWRGVHCFVPSPGGMALLKRAIAEVLVPMGVNAVVLEVNYRFEYQSHPELRQSNPISKALARDLAACCREHKVRLIPQFNCLGHQSWRASTLPLLVKYPELDETPKISKQNRWIYCRSWCPLHPRVNEIILPMIDELIDAFESDAFHVGMDEVWLIASNQCPRCRDKDPADLFAKAVNDYHRHLVGRRRQTMLMWGDRLINGKTMPYGPWESSWNGTAAAIDKIPKDIIICDWHYGLQDDYPSVRYFQQKGFRVWPASWGAVKAALSLLDCGRRDATDRMIGHLCTTWTGADGLSRELLKGPGHPKRGDVTSNAAAALRACMARLRE